MDLPIWFSDGFTFGWSQFEAVNWAIVDANLLENRVCGGHFDLHNLFVKPDHYEELKIQPLPFLSTFNLSLPLVFCNWPGRTLKLVK
jgi:hypothetical protein